MKKYNFSFRVQQEFEAPVTGHSFLLRCFPGTHPFQRTYAHSFSCKPFTAMSVVNDSFDNEMYTGTIDKAHRSFTYTSSGFVLASKYFSHDPLDRLYLYPSKSTIPSEAMRQLIRNADLPANELSRASFLCRITGTLLTLVDRPGCRPAAEVFTEGKGNAQEIAQVLVALCRLAGIAARCVTGFAVGIGIPHSWAEVYCGNVWRAFDPTKNLLIETDYLKVAHGQEYSSCIMQRNCFRETDVAYTETASVSVTEHIVLTRDTVPHA